MRGVEYQDDRCSDSSRKPEQAIPLRQAQGKLHRWPTSPLQDDPGVADRGGAGSLSPSVLRCPCPVVRRLGRDYLGIEGTCPERSRRTSPSKYNAVESLAFLRFTQDRHRPQRGGEDDAYFDGLSTRLKVLSRITDPTEGEAEVRGRVGSLLEAVP